MNPIINRPVALQLLNAISYDLMYHVLTTPAYFSTLFLSTMVSKNSHFVCINTKTSSFTINKVKLNPTITVNLNHIPM